MNAFNDQFAAAVHDGSFLHLVLGSPIKDVEPTTTKLSARPVELRDGLQFQMTRHDPTRETHINLGGSEFIAEVQRLLGAHFRHAHLFTTTADITAKVRASGKLKMKTRPPSKGARSIAHNREKSHLVPEGTPCPFLEEIGIMDANGRVFPSKYDKFKQINRFLEFIDDIYPNLPETGTIRVIDFGCGKSYLTFAIHHLLVGIHGRKTDLLGVDLKKEVIEECQAIADRLHCEGLHFQAGDIRDIEPAGQVDLVVSLHACDTATDIALAKAVHWQAGAILSVPCCHHEFASSMDERALPSLQRHGILRERLAELSTDAYRADMLDAAGYRAGVLEFIDLEHTARNILIRATRRPDGATNRDARHKAQKLLDELGITSTTLGNLLPPA